MLRIWPPGCVTCIVTLPWIVLLALSGSIELVSLSARVTSVKFQKGVVLTDGRTSGPKDRTPGLPGSDKYKYMNIRNTNTNTYIYIQNTNTYV